jgi:hypothetical protein
LKNDKNQKINLKSTCNNNNNNSNSGSNNDNNKEVSQRYIGGGIIEPSSEELNVPYLDKKSSQSFSIENELDVQENENKKRSLRFIDKEFNVPLKEGKPISKEELHVSQTKSLLSILKVNSTSSFSNKVSKDSIENKVNTKGVSKWEILNESYVDKNIKIPSTKLANRFNLTGVPVKGAKTPMDPNLKLSKPDEKDIVGADSFDYMSAVGGLLYISITTRPDIALSGGVLSRFMSCPGEDHVTAARRVISYLYHTRTYGIRYCRITPIEGVGAPHQHDHPEVYYHSRKTSAATEGEQDEKILHAYVDADLAGDRDTMRSTTGFVIMLYGGVICYSAKLQSTVALSTAEAETNAAVEAVKQLCHIRLFLEELGIKQNYSTKMYDSNAVMQLVKALMKFHFLIEKKSNGTFLMENVDTVHQLADAFTKALPDAAFSRYRKWMGVNQSLNALGSSISKF